MVRNKKTGIFLIALLCGELMYASKGALKNMAKITPVKSYTKVAVKSKQVTAIQGDVHTDNAVFFYEHSEQQADSFSPNASKSTVSLTPNSSSSGQAIVLTKDSLRTNNQKYKLEKKVKASDVEGVTLDDMFNSNIKEKPIVQAGKHIIGKKVNKVAVESPDSLTITDEIQVSDSLDLNGTDLESRIRNAAADMQAKRQVVQQKPSMLIKNKNALHTSMAREELADTIEPIDEEELQEEIEEKLTEKPVAKISFLQSIQDFFKRKENVNAINRNGKTPLQQAVSDHDFGEVQRLIEAGADLTIQNVDGNGLLHISVQIPNSNRKFVQAKSNSMQVDDIQASLKIVKSLIEKAKGQNPAGINLLNQRNKAGQTPLHVAIENVNELAVRELIAAGADVNLVDNQGRTPVMAAVSSELPAYRGVSKNPSQQVLANIINQLIDARADLSIPNKHGRTVRDESSYQIKQYQRLTPEIGNTIHNALSSSSSAAKKIVAVKPAVPKRPMPTTAPMYKPLSEIQKNSSKTVILY